MSVLRVRVAWAEPESQGEIAVELPEPANVQMAIDAACQSVPGIATIAANAVAVGVWGKVRARDHWLRDGDRVEFYRALQADPKDARRANAKRSPDKTGKM
ncbi:MAG: RnfH family protein [Betaproteobacteria bacterium]|nr:RnfH family protein [Betaproteobacteria bacterium]